MFLSSRSSTLCCHWNTKVRPDFCLCNLKYYLHSHRCPWFRPCFRVYLIHFVTLFCHTSEFYPERLPGEARQNPRSEFFLVLNNFIFSSAIFRVKGNLYSKTDFKGKISFGLQCLKHVQTFLGKWSPVFFF